jgi:hypothetical protein
MSANAVDAAVAPVGPAGGALAGTYPNPAVAVPLALQGAAGANPVFGAGTVADANNRIELDANGTIRLGSGAAPTDTILSRTANGTFGAPNLTLSGVNGLDISAAGAGLKVAEGANAKQGLATLVAGTKTVANTSVTANSRISLTGQNDNGGTPGFLRVTAITAATSFVITSSNVADTSIVFFEIWEPG